MEQKIEALRTVGQQCETLELRLADKNAQAQTLKIELDESVQKSLGLSNQVHDLELALATANAKLAAQQGIVAELGTYLDVRDRTGKIKTN